jgi:uncharacterized protein YjbI with pentapeptide repeats
MANLPNEWLEGRGTQKFVRRGDASGRDLRRADLTNIRVQGVDVSDADLREADLADFRAEDSNFARAKFVGAALRGAKFFDCVLSKADFSACLMDQIMLGACTCMDAKLDDAVLRGADVVGTFFSRSRMARVDLRKALAKQAVFDNVDLTDADLRGGHFEKVDFRGAHLTGVKWDGAHLDGALFDEGSGARMLNDALRQSPQHGPEAYGALECSEGPLTWYVVERRVDATEVIKADIPRRTSEGLLLQFELLDATLPPLVAYAIMAKVLLGGLLADAHGSYKGPLLFHDKSSAYTFALPV